jgi:phosphatase NudJ
LVIFVARPADDAEPRATTDSLGAAWVTLDELDRLELRGGEVRELFHYIASGGAVYPLSLLAVEGAPLPSSR